MLSPTRRLYVLLLSQLLLCWLETYLISKISLIGKIGIATFYHEYAPLRSFWKTYLLLSFFQVAVIITLYIVGKRSTKKMTNLVSTILLTVGLLGLVLTFQDFLHTYSHRLLKERFHLGFYFFWLSWMASCLFFLFSKAAPVSAAPPFPLDPDAPLITQPQHQDPPPAPYTPAVKEQP